MSRAKYTKTDTVAMNLINAISAAGGSASQEYLMRTTAYSPDQIERGFQRAKHEAQRLGLVVGKINGLYGLWEPGEEARLILTRETRYAATRAGTALASAVKPAGVWDWIDTRMVWNMTNGVISLEESTGGISERMEEVRELVLTKGVSN